MKISKITLLILGFVLLYTIRGSSQHDNCIDAFRISDPSNYCSLPGAFNNNGPRPYRGEICLSEGTATYFSFTATATDIDIFINGNSSQAAGGTLNTPEVGLFRLTTCNENASGGPILECGQAQPGSGLVQIYQGGLIPGNEYFIIVKGVGEETGTFQICTRNYYPPANPGSDCSSASILCDKSSFSVEQVIGAGDDRFELDGNNCFSTGFSSIGNETNSVWFKWTCDEAGSLTFDITPSNPIDDLDFILFELDDIEDCGSRQILRCMAAGNRPQLYPSVCHGTTGLREGNDDTSENAGCRQGQNNFLAPVQMESGKSYALAINNYSSTGNGLSIDFGGTGTFLGPKPVLKLSADTLQCDRAIVFTDSSYFSNGNIVKKEWTFGKNASLESAEGDGPHEIVYQGFGLKDISLTVTSDRGCKTTLLEKLPILECCALDSDLDAQVISASNPSCPNLRDGQIRVEGLNGSVQGNYQYKLLPDGDTTIRQTYENLPEGNYSFIIFDDKGCEVRVDTFITDPPELTLDMNLDKTDFELGEEVQVNLVYNPTSYVPSYVISNGDTLDCMTTDCLNFTDFPLENANYKSTLVTERGCRASDSAAVTVLKVRNIYFPNAIKQSAQNESNRFFSIFSNRPKSISKIIKIKVFDRWGEFIKEWTDIPINFNEPNYEYIFRNEALPTGIYIFYAEVEFIDGFVQELKGDFLVLP